MHSSEVTAATPAPATGPALLLQLGRLIIRSRSSSPAPRAPLPPRDRLLHAKLLAAKPSTSNQIQSQPKPETEEATPGLESQLSNHVHALWKDQIPVCIEVLLAPECPECYASLARVEEGSFDKLHSRRGLLLERWTMRARVTKNHEAPAFITSQWLLNAVRSQLHFSQLSAWLARLKSSQGDADATERRRKLSRETCNFKKLESNCDETDPAKDERKLNIVYSIKIPGESYKMTEFSRPPNDHTFPVTDIGNNIYLKVNLESLPRIDDIPTVKCTCQKRRASKEVPINVHEELVTKLNDLTLGTKYESIKSNMGCSTRRLSISNSSTEYVQRNQDNKEQTDKIVDDRMHTTCSENGKHKCSCDDESDNLNQRSSTSFSQPKKLDEKRLKEIAKYKRRLRKESKLKKLCDSTSSEGDLQKAKETHTSIPILQAARFDRFKAIGCYRNQTYLTLPASRIECKSPFVDSVSIPPSDFKKSVSVATQTDDLSCQCGNKIMLKCDGCSRGMVRSEGNYNLASFEKSEALVDRVHEENGVRRKCEDEDKCFKKLKCDLSSNLKCDNNIYNNVVVGSSSTDFNESNDKNETSKCESNESNTKCINTEDGLIKRTKLRRFFPIVDKIEKIVTDRLSNADKYSDADKNAQIDETPKTKETKRQKTYSINDDDYVLLEKCDYGTIDRCEMESPKDEQNGFRFPEEIDDKNEDDTANTQDFKNCVPEAQVPSPTEMDRFRYRFDSAASMVFHTKTGLPLTSSPAPLKRGNNCFDFDDSINGVSGIKSALFHPVIPPASPATPPPAPAPPPAPPRPLATESPFKKEPAPKLRIGPSAGLLGSFEESALKGRLEPVATVHGFTAELGASGAFCPPHKRLPVTVFFYAPGGTNAPYMGHINLGPGGYRVARSGTIQVSLFNPHGTLVKMFVVLYDLTSMPPNARTFLRQRTLYMPAGAEPPRPDHLHKWLRYLIHLRFMTSKSGKMYLHTDIRIIVSRKADVDTATAHSALFRPPPTNRIAVPPPPTNHEAQNQPNETESTNDVAGTSKVTNRAPNRVFGGCSDFDVENKMKEIGYDNQSGVSYELRSFTYAPENPKYSPR